VRGVEQVGPIDDADQPPAASTTGTILRWCSVMTRATSESALSGSTAQVGVTMRSRAATLGALEIPTPRISAPTTPRRPTQRAQNRCVAQDADDAAGLVHDDRPVQPCGANGVNDLGQLRADGYDGRIGPHHVAGHTDRRRRCRGGSLLAGKASATARSTSAAR